MRQALKPHSTKVPNLLGQSFHNAKQSAQLHYKAALLDAGEKDGVNYWRAFRDVWQYADNVGSAPFIIPALAIEILGYVHGQTSKA
jgi:hypothetical protein